MSALLLFAVQPMFTKMVLPLLGGSPAVWSVAMVFFQGLLLLGYMWAHVLAKSVSVQVAAGLHLIVCALAFLALPISVPLDAVPPSQGQAFWLAGLFAMSVGLPFFALSANGPLLQAWFARSGQPRASDPYFLYGASNLGSFAALLAYPFVIEPFLGLSGQSRLWMAGFGVLVAGLAGCAFIAAGNPSARAQTDVEGWADIITAKAPARSDYFSWTLLGLVPSGLLVSVTAHISTDIGAAPLLWVVPLALYLLSFVVAFRDRSSVDSPFAMRAVVWLVGLSLLLPVLQAIPIAFNFIFTLLTFFVAAAVAHRTLYLKRPDAGHLTTFYVCMSLGGVLGGLSTALVAPAILSNLYEYPALLVATLLCRPQAIASLRAVPGRTLAILVGLCSAALIAVFAVTAPTEIGNVARMAPATAFLAAAMLRWRDMAQSFVLVAFAGLAVTSFDVLASKGETHRSFFGVLKVGESANGKFRLLFHGTTMHGAMRIAMAEGDEASGARPHPTTYYTFAGPMGQAIQSVRNDRGGRLGHLAVIGLGVGALACHSQPGEALTYYEIDPLVVEIARNPRLFRFLSNCAPQAPVVMGDARLTLAHQSERSDVIVVDAFSSDAIPMHLLTREAVALMQSKLAPRGVLVFHISNRVMNFSGVLSRVAADLGLTALRNSDLRAYPDDPDMRTSSIVMALVRDPSDLGKLASAAVAWKPVVPDMGARVWTDDYSTILDPLRVRLLFVP